MQIIYLLWLLSISMSVAFNKPSTNEMNPKKDKTNNLKTITPNLFSHKDIKPTWTDRTVCLGCLFVWEGVDDVIGVKEDDVDFSSDQVSRIFDSICKQQLDVFNESCTEMYRVLDYLIEDFMDDKFSLEICSNSGLCYPKVLKDDE